MKYTEMNRAELEQEYARVKGIFGDLCAEGLSLNLARGKPASEQLDLSNGMPATLDGNYICDGMDVRNYGGLEGLPSCRKLFADILGVETENVVIGGNASLNMMYDLIAKAFTHGLKHSERPWSQETVVKFLCPAPGYDRHFNLTQSFGVELITVPMTQDGPDMDMVEELVKDPAVKGIWCVPKYSNPDGYIYSEETCRRLASMETAAPDFTIMWDNAYCIHEIEGEFVPFIEMLSLCAEYGNPDRVYEFASTSKITFAGAGVSCMAASVENVKYMLSLMTFQTIGANKVNQLMHVRFLKDKEGTLAHMKRHAAILKPKFDAVLKQLDTDVAPAGIAQWNRPKGGYFVSLNAMHGTAKRTLALCKEAGVVMTSAGATFPYGIDPNDSNIRIAPSLPTLPELEKAAQVFCTSLRLAALEKLLEA